MYGYRIIRKGKVIEEKRGFTEGEAHYLGFFRAKELGGTFEVFRT